MRSNQNNVHEISVLTRIPPFCRGANSPDRKIYYKLGKLDLLTNWDCDQVLPNFRNWTNDRAGQHKVVVRYVCASYPWNANVFRPSELVTGAVHTSINFQETFNPS